MLRGWEMKHQTADFARLYGMVTAQLSSLASDLYWRDKPDREWLAHLVIVFQQLFEDWDRDPSLRLYLDALERWPSPEGRRVHRVFRLAGHVYLHVAYDLVRGIAGTLDAPSPVLPSDLQLANPSSAWFLSPAPKIERPEARLTFLAAAPAFAAALDSEEGVNLLGDVSMWAKLLGVLTRHKRRLALQAIGQWVLALRNAALITAETIADSPSPRRAAIVTKLRDGIERAQTSVSDRFSITDVYPWSFPVLGFAPLALWDLPPWASVLVWLLMLAGGWIVAVMFIRRRQQKLLDAINALGEAMFEALIAARGEGERSRKTVG